MKNPYERLIDRELAAWEADIQKQQGALGRFAKSVQNGTRKLIPAGVEDAVTSVIARLIRALMSGASVVTVTGDTSGLTLAEREYLVMRYADRSVKTALTEGALTGAAGFLGGLDLPLLMSIQISLLSNMAKLYGYDPDAKEERLYMLLILQVAFSSRQHRLSCYRQLKEWPSGAGDIDWKTLQEEYRDSMDWAKFLQMVPLLGAPVGAAANRALMIRLRDNAMNAYRMRFLADRKEGD